MKCPKCRTGTIRVVDMVTIPDGGDDSKPVVCDTCCTSYTMEFGPNPNRGKNQLHDENRDMITSALQLGGSEEEFKDLVSQLPTVDEYRAEYYPNAP